MIILNLVQIIHPPVSITNSIDPYLDDIDSKFILGAIHVKEQACVDVLLSDIANGKYEKKADSTFSQYLQAICDKEAHNLRAQFVVQHLHARLAHRNKLYAAWRALVSVPVLELLEGL